MGSISIDQFHEYLQKHYPLLSKEKAIAKFLQDNLYHAIVRYKTHENGKFTQYGQCSKPSDIHGYFSSPYCFDSEVIYKREIIEKSNISLVEHNQNIAVILFVLGTNESPSHSVNLYCNSVIWSNYSPNIKVVDDSLVIGMKYDWNDEDALYLAEAGYKRFVSWGQIQDFGTPLDFFKGYDANGNRIVGLIFKLNLEVND